MYFENCDVENGLIAWRSNVGRALRLPDEFAVRLHSSRRGALKFHQGSPDSSDQCFGRRSFIGLINANNAVISQMVAQKLSILCDKQIIAGSRIHLFADVAMKDGGLISIRPNFISCISITDDNAMMFECGAGLVKVALQERYAVTLSGSSAADFIRIFFAVGQCRFS
ncbi:hypothetical protein T4B_14456 [Trichinella pseudospiralis]|uniref:Uncharacterized protein n=1 Tax=Trichinella pseudospiralis TaxID=6337 RepID=A0A0V1IFK4_TRIPS|nr:hypothetical protein T4B_14456 [Trichinella pseudospiralis]